MRWIITLPLLALLSTPAHATVYCVSGDASASDLNAATSAAGDCSDVSDANAWQTFSKAVSSTGKSAGDTVLFKKGVTFNITSSPSSSTYAQGALGSLQTLTGWNTASNWTQYSSTVWYMRWDSDWPRELWIDGVEYSESVHQKDVDATNRWSWRPSNGRTATQFRLYVYSTGNPASTYSTMQYRDTSGHITWGAYGSGAKPIIDCINQISGSNVAGNWTDNSATRANTWYMTRSSKPGRVWFDGVEYQKAQTYNGTNGVDATLRYYWDSGASRLYVYATSNPATFYTTIEDCSGCSVVIDLRKNYMKWTGIELRGGSQASVNVRAASELILDNMTVGYGVYGIQVQLGPTPAFLENENLIIRDSTISSEHEFPSTGYDDEGVEEGIDFRSGVRRALVYRNLIENWPHCDFNQEGNDTNGIGAVENRFFGNETHTANTLSGRQFSFNCLPGKCYGNEIFYNYFHDGTAQSKLDGGGNWVHHNLFYNNRNPFYLSGTQGSAGFVTFICLGATQESADNILENNVFYENPEAAILMDQQSSSSCTKSGHIIRNNLILECGDAPLIGAASDNASMIVEKGSNVGGNTWQNNQMWNSTATTGVLYGGTFSNGTWTSVSDFNALNGDASNVIGGNQLGDPSVVSASTLNFTPNPGSPMINNGYTTQPDLDYAGNSIPSGSGYEIGLFESQSSSRMGGVRFSGVRIS